MKKNKFTSIALVIFTLVATVMVAQPTDRPANEGIGIDLPTENVGAMKAYAH